MIKWYWNHNKDLRVIIIIHNYHNYNIIIIIYTEQINKIRRSSNDDKRLQTFDKITTYPSGTNAFKVCEIEMISKK